MRKIGPFITLFIILGLPLVIYLVLRTGTHVVKPLRTISQKIADPGGGPDSVYKAVGKFALQSHTGATITQDSFADHIWVANVFKADCQDECATLLQSVRDIQEYYTSSSDVRFLSVLLNAPGDTAVDLKAVARHYEAIDGKWHFAQGTPDSVAEFAHLELDYGDALPDSGATLKADYTLRLVDHYGLFRGAYYNVLEPKEVDSAISHIRLLQREFEQSRR